jgi:uncharacterized repeat protein (TIGR03806 family)
VLALITAAHACRPFGEQPATETTQASLTCRAPVRREGRARLENAFPALTFVGPTRLVRAQLAGDARWFVAERTGKVLSFADRKDAREAIPFADLAAAGRIFEGSLDDGLMGFAIHPRFAENGQVFFAYTAPPSDPAAGPLEYHIARGRSTDGGRTLDVSTLETMIAFPKKESIHHGGAMAFGPDGMLYVATGDGAMGDPPGNAQQKASLMGKVLRIDVDAPSLPYAVPPDNPFVADAGARPEIWALGFRNPWTMSFDRETGALWLGDVGQHRWEEIDVVTRGGNYGWRVKEGTQCYRTSTCTDAGFVDPVFVYSHGEGFSITAGFTYRGAALPDLRGAFLISDFITGRVSAVREGRAQAIVESGLNVSALVEDRDGEALVVDYLTGTILRLLPDVRPSTIPRKLSETGCFDTRTGSASAELFPYDVQTPLWSDGAAKQRWLMIPDGVSIGIGPEGEWVLPTGTLVFKTFVAHGRNVETRMLAKHEEGGWAGYTYAWDDDGADATLLDDGWLRDFGEGRSWSYPSRGDCFSCHNLAAGRTLGLSTPQMSKNGQIEALLARGWLEPNSVAPVPPPVTLDERARAYLDVNCSNCHRPSGPAAGLGDLRRDRELHRMGICNIAALDVEGAPFRLQPGDPAASAIVERMRSNGPQRMPPLASAVVDEEGASLVEQWISGLDDEACPLFRLTP